MNIHSYLPEVQEQERESGVEKDVELSSVGVGNLWRFGWNREQLLNSWVSSICSFNLGFWESLSFTGDFPYDLRTGWLRSLFN